MSPAGKRRKKPPVFEGLRKAGFDVRFTYHANAILDQDFPDAVAELERTIGVVSVPVAELIGGGGGEAQITQRLRHSLQDCGWRKATFNVEKKINEQTTFSQSHEVDHVKTLEAGKIALEIEWNNKDPFFDRDLENFNRLHADGAISIGVIVTRGASFQEGLEGCLSQFAAEEGLNSFDRLARFGVAPTARQRKAVERYMERNKCLFPKAWAACFFADKFGAATTHWAKLNQRLDRGVGSPCPVVGIGIPLTRVTGIPAAQASRSPAGGT